MKPIVATLVVLCAVLSAPASAVAADVPDRRDVQRALDEMVAGGAPGTIAVIQGPKGREVYRAGLADVRTERRLTAGDHFRAGSVNKTFTATVVLQLVAERKLRLEDTVQQWLPGLLPDGDQILVRQLLSHSSGLADYCEVQDEVCVPPVAVMGRRWDPRELVAIGAEAPRTFAPGQGWNYSNTGFVLLGLIVERVTGKAFGAELERRIIRPLRLRETSFPSETRLPRPFGHGYDVMAAGSWPADVTATSPTIAWTAGGIVSTPDDLIRFMRALQAGQLLPAPLLTEMRRPTPYSLDGPTALGFGPYGLGLFHFTWSKACGMWGHGGDIPGFHTFAGSTANGRRGAAMYVTADGLSAPGAIANLKAERLLACRARFGRIGSGR